MGWTFTATNYKTLSHVWAKVSRQEEKKLGKKKILVHTADENKMKKR